MSGFSLLVHADDVSRSRFQSFLLRIEAISTASASFEADVQREADLRRESLDFVKQ